MKTVVQRAFLLRDTENVTMEGGHLLLLWGAFSEAYGQSDNKIMDKVNALVAHGFGDCEPMDLGGRYVDAIQLGALPGGGWSFWLDLAEFCEKAGEPLEAFIERLEFSRFDDPS